MTDAEKAATQPSTAAETAAERTTSTGEGGASAVETYPPAVSSYYFGPPDASRAFGQPVTGKPGVHVPKEIVR